MEVDNEVTDVVMAEAVEETTTAPRTDGPRRLNVIIDDAHPFDLDAYISGYSGRTAAFRLLHIIKSCPTLAKPAFETAVGLIRQLREVALYESAVASCNAVSGKNAVSVDPKWVEETNAKNQSERNKLEVELKTYQSNMIKESIRMAHRDLGDFYRAIGDESAAIKNYSKSREFCTASQHVLDTCLTVLEFLMEQRNYNHLQTYIFKADAALEVVAPANAKASASTTGASATQPAGQTQKKAAVSASEREKVQSKLDLANAISYLGQRAYEKAAFSFTRVTGPKALDEWIGKVISASDIAIYGALCALATFSRRAIRSQILENEHFTIFLEYEPYVRELVEAFLGSKFKVVRELLEKYSSRHYLDIHLTHHIESLSNLIINRALVFYFQPFTSIKLQRMAQAFGLPVDELEKFIIPLIQSGDIQARIDSSNKILRAKETDSRALMYAKAVKTGNDMQSINRKLLYRMALQQNDLVIKAPKNRRAQELNPGNAMEAEHLSD